MKVDDNDFRRRYEELSNEGLLSINREELVDVARQCYEHELARRGLESESEVIEEAAGLDDVLIPAATFMFPDEAGVARALLRSVNILCYIENEHTLSAVWTWSYALGGLRLMVPRSRIEQANEILNEIPSGKAFTTGNGTYAQIEMAVENTSAMLGNGRGEGRARTALVMALLCSPEVELLRLFYL